MVELLVSTTLLLVIVALTIPFFRSQARSLERNAGRLDAQQNARFGVRTIDRELRVAGIGVVDAQPIIVHADSRVLVFNADLATGTPGDVGAVYFNPDLPATELTSLTAGRRTRIPTTGFWYPDTTYRGTSGGATSGAETIMFWVAPDSARPGGNEFVLWRRVNDAPPAMLAAGLRLEPGDAVFRYTKVDSLGRPVAIPPSALPYSHVAPVHGVVTGSRPDTGLSARSDSIRAVAVRLVGLFRDPRGNPVLDTVETSIRIVNAGLNRVASCGEAPLFGSTPAARVVAVPSGGTGAEISWSPATDEASGEKDVERYAVYRRREGEAAFVDEPIVIIPADGRLSSYSHIDVDVSPGDRWQYAVDAQDCSPSASILAMTAVIAF